MDVRSEANAEGPCLIACWLIQYENDLSLVQFNTVTNCCLMNEYVAVAD